MGRSEDYSEVRGRFCTEMQPDPCGIVIFGASGDLTHRKLLPALFNLFTRNLLAEEFFILGCARSGMTDGAFRERVRDSITESLGDKSGSGVNEFVRRCAYHTGDYTSPETYTSLS